MRQKFLSGFSCCVVSAIVLMIPDASIRAEVHMANGIKIGEVDADSAIIWTRLTANPERVRSGIAFLPLDNVKKNHEGRDGRDQIPAEVTLDEMEGAVPGKQGEVRLTYWPESNADQSKTTGWQAVEPDQDFTRHFRLSELSPWTRYSLRVEGKPAKSETITSTVEGSFTTAPLSDQKETVRLVVTTCGEYIRRDDPENGHLIYRVIVEQVQPHFFVHAGDIEYYDKKDPWALSVPLARYKMNRLYAMPYNRLLHNSTASYFMKDDHDITIDDSWPGRNFGMLRWEDGLAIFDEQFPMGDKPYRTVRWGKDLQIWLVEGRNYRSPNKMPDGPDKSIWGREQKQWFFDSVNQSDATFKLLISPTPIVGPDRLKKNDNHANKGFSHEGNEIRRFIAGHSNLFIANGDRHWQYYSIDDETGVREFSCGPHSDLHAGGFSQKNASPEHQFLRVKGGFLSVEVTRDTGEPSIAFRHHKVSGEVVNEVIFGE